MKEEGGGCVASSVRDAGITSGFGALKQPSAMVAAMVGNSSSVIDPRHSSSKVLIVTPVPGYDKHTNAEDTHKHGNKHHSARI